MINRKKDSFELLKVVLKMLEFTDAERNAYLENIKSKGKKSNFAKILLGL